MDTKKTVLVIGAGFSGILSIKCLKEEGLEPVCYEKTSQAGGTWFYREQAKDGVASTMRTTITTNSKEMGALSNFIPDKSYPNYMRVHEMFHMFTEIGKQFDCFRHITYGREVTSVKRASDFDETGRWNVASTNTETGEVSVETFDAVCVGVGHFSRPKMPDYPGLKDFQGRVIHSHALKTTQEFVNKKVLVVGSGHSAVDAAVEISHQASQVYLSTRKGVWIFPRVGPYGLPFDFVLVRRYAALLSSIFGEKITSWTFEKFLRYRNFCHDLYELRPEQPVLHGDHTISDFLPSKVLSGFIAIKRNVRRFTTRGVVFEDHDKVTELDAVVFATGYHCQFPFLEDDLVRNQEGHVNLYKCIFPPNLTHPTLAVIGFFLAFGAGIPIDEMQCRFAARVFSGKVTLPSRDAMLKDIAKRNEKNAKYFSPSDRLPIRVFNLPYLDELADEIGCRPSLLNILFTDFELFKALVFGPALPYHYRLEGPHKWEGAREAILTAPERVRYPLSGDRQKISKFSFNLTGYLRYAAVVSVIAFGLTLKEFKNCIRFCMAEDEF